jgi:CBS domain-containing protein
LEQAIIEAERIIGDFYQPGSGLLFVMPVSRVVGIYRPESNKEEPGKSLAPPVREALTRADLNARETTVAVIDRILNLEPVIVEANRPLLEVAEMMINHPNVHVACVVNEHQRLVGLLTLRSLADDLLMTVFPEEFLSETHDLEDALHFAHLSRTQSAADAMIPAVWVKENDTLKDAFRKMHDHQLSGMPIIDDRYQVIGYINLLELLATYARSSQQGEDQENQADG